MPSLPTQRTLKELKNMGAMAQVVEKWVSFARKRIDLFGCIDIIAIIPRHTCESERFCGRRTVGIQACAGSSHAARRAKSLAEPRLGEWLEAGNKFEIWSWSKKGERGKRKLWTLRREEITLEDFCQQCSPQVKDSPIENREPCTATT